jgi:uncharacterized protein (TIGR02246 family)
MEKNMLKRIFLTIALLMGATNALALQPVSEEVKKLTETWQSAIASRNAVTITNLYDNHAFLYATFEDMLDSRESILSYFEKLVKHKDLKVTFDKENVRSYGETVINSGLYTFSYEENGKIVKVPARYTFVYAHEPKGWFIVEHHSSQLPN